MKWFVSVVAVLMIGLALWGGRREQVDLSDVSFDEEPLVIEQPKEEPKKEEPKKVEPEKKPEPKKKWPEKPIIDNAGKSPSCPGGVCPTPRYVPRWTIDESDIYAELRNRHGINADHLSVDEAYRLHDSLHDKIGPVPAPRTGLFGRWIGR